MYNTCTINYRSDKNHNGISFNKICSDGINRCFEPYVEPNSDIIVHVITGNVDSVEDFIRYNGVTRDYKNIKDLFFDDSIELTVNENVFSFYAYGHMLEIECYVNKFCKKYFIIAIKEL